MSDIKKAIIKAYYKFELLKGSGKTPKYRLIKAAGDYPPFEYLKGVRGKGKGQIYMYLLGRIDDNNGRAPEFRLQAAKSFPFTGLKQFWQDGKMSGYAYGELPQTETYGKKHPRPNPFYPDYISDGLIFKFGDTCSVKLGESECLLPESFELLVIDKGKALAAGYCAQLKNGGFDELLEELRKQAKDV